MKPIASYKNWQQKLNTIENPGLNLSVETLRDNSFENYVFDDLQFFATWHVPHKPNKLYLKEEELQRWCEHDALHYLGQQPFSVDGELGVNYLEIKFYRGYFPISSFQEMFFRSMKECEYSHITQELIDETANLIRGFYV